MQNDALMQSWGLKGLKALKASLNDLNYCNLRYHGYVVSCCRAQQRHDVWMGL